jgi:glycosyltransferase involved in cell wall biosynthesis
MTDVPKISVIIPFYNCEFIHEAIASVLAQDYVNIEIIVVDDGSDSEQYRIKPYRDKIKYYYKPNGGTASALNFGITKATGEYFAWLSADDRFLPRKLSRQYQFMKKSNALASFSAFYFMDASGQRLSDAIRCKFATKIEFYNILLRGCPINGCTVMLHMNVLRKIGLFDTKRKYTHDYDLWLRMLPHYDFHYLDEALVDYRVHDKMGTLTHKTEIELDVQFVQAIHYDSIDELIQQEGGA